MVPLDVRDPGQCAAAVAEATARFGGVDVLVNNAGYAQMGVVEEVSDAELAAQLDTNLFGPWRLTRLVLPQWRERGGGHAIFASSLSGMVAFPGLAAYTASKFALEGLAEALAAEAGPLGVKVTILQVGGYATSAGKKSVDPQQPIAVYEPIVSEVRTMVRTLAERTDVDRPESFAETVARLAELPDPPLRVPLGGLWREYLEGAVQARREALDWV